MRLLECNSAGEFSLTEDIVDDDKIPPYAILSHTWNEGEEVAFQELIDGTGKVKPGYEKIRFCAAQAKRDGLRHFWVDTCCINRSNNSELSEAINSMFRWYRGATRCYVYLLDVSSGVSDTRDKPSILPFESAFRGSRWFTRGWTLQELLAPSSVEFFSREGNRLGDKQSLQQKIHEITGITIQALQENSLSQFSVDERLSWAQNRQTTRKEDQAYALLGIFDVYMPLIYGEGRDNALKRLLKKIYKPLQGIPNSGQHLIRQIRRVLTRYLGPDRLPNADGAPFNSTTKQHLPTCLPDTRVELLQEIYSWAGGHDERCIFWLNGLAGTGKSTISRTVARKWYKEGCLGASFFFSRGGGDVGHAGKLVTSIAVQLASSVPIIYRFICDAITQHSDISTRSLRDQWQLLVLDPLSKLDGNVCRASYVLVVDALDECDDDNSIQLILQLFAEARSLQKVQLRVFLTSRAEIPIRYGICQIPDAEHQDFVLHNISPSIIDHDIFIFLEYNFRLIRQERSLDAAWPGEEIIRYLVQTASGLFIWAATACRFIREGKRFATKRLDTILNGTGSTVTAPEKHLNEIYISVLKHSVSPEYTYEEKEELYHMLRQILGSIAILFSPLSVYSLNSLLCVTKEDIDQTLEDLHSIVDSPKDQTQPLRLHHPSFRDFLLNNDRCKDLNFWVDEKQAHQTLADRCIRLMSTSLKQDICGLHTPGVLVTDVANTRVEQCLPPEVRYACLYWVQHLQKGSTQLHDSHQVHQFLQVHLLHWLEALGWIGKSSEGILAILALETLIPVSLLYNILESLN